LANAVDTMKEILAGNPQEADTLIRRAISLHAL
jgi:hypothetical protein